MNKPDVIDIKRIEGLEVFENWLKEAKIEYERVYDQKAIYESKFNGCDWFPDFLLNPEDDNRTIVVDVKNVKPKYPDFRALNVNDEKGSSQFSAVTGISWWYAFLEPNGTWLCIDAKTFFMEAVTPNGDQKIRSTKKEEFVVVKSADALRKLFFKGAI